MSNLIVTVIISFAMMPFVISALGDKWYGLWAVIGGIIGYYSIIDFGILSATQRFFSKALHNKDYQKCNIIFNNASFLLLMCSLVTTFITFIVWLLPAFLTLDAESATTFRTLILIMGIKCVFMFPFLIFNGMLSAALKYTTTTTIELLKLFIRTALIYYYLEHGAGIIALAWITVFCEIIGYTIVSYIALKTFPFCHYNYRKVNKNNVLELANFGKYSFIIELGTLLKSNIDTLIISTFLTLSSVTLYIIPFRLFTYATEFLNGLLAGVMPVFATNWQQSPEQQKILKKHFLLFTETSTMLSTLVFCGLVIFGADFISIWMSGKYSEAYPILLVFSIMMLLVNSNNACISLFYAAAKHQKLAKWGIIESIFKISIGIILIKEFGLIGLACSALIPAIYIQCFIQPAYACSLLDIKTTTYWHVIKRYWILATVILVARLVLINIQLTESFLMLALLGTIYLLVFFWFVFQFIASDSLIDDLETRFPRIIKKLVWSKRHRYR